MRRYPERYTADTDKGVFTGTLSVISRTLSDLAPAKARVGRAHDGAVMVDLSGMDLGAYDWSTLQAFISTELLRKELLTNAPDDVRFYTPKD